jgi:hypothetical protein
MRLYRLRGQSADAPAHLWGGKRLAETWRPGRRQLTISLQGPPGLTDTAFVWVGDRGVSKVLLDGKEAKFSLDSTQGVVHGPVTFSSRPVKVDLFLGDRSSGRLPEALAPPDVLGQRKL